MFIFLLEGEINIPSHLFLRSVFIFFFVLKVYSL
jgi:hypothetical protein